MTICDFDANVVLGFFESKVRHMIQNVQSNAIKMCVGKLVYFIKKEERDRWTINNDFNVACVRERHYVISLTHTLVGQLRRKTAKLLTCC